MSLMSPARHMSEPIPYQVAKIAVLGNGLMTTVHTVDSHRWLRIENIHLCNVTGGAVTVQFCLVPYGGSSGTTTALLYAFSIPANDFIEFGEGLRLGPGGLVRGLANAADAITAHLSGIEEIRTGV